MVFLKGRWDRFTGLKDRHVERREKSCPSFLWQRRTPGAEKRKRGVCSREKKTEDEKDISKAGTSFREDEFAARKRRT